ncbi:MAG: MMPL family transporter [Saprospiraceae bacterium]|nr:MMPL family transporter [Saprospiraceae bacterium]
MSRLRIELTNGLTLLYALKRSYLTTGKSLTITTCILLTGFLSLLTSSFGSAYSIGLLISLGLLFALLLNLTLLPILLLLLYKK